MLPIVTALGATVVLAASLIVNRAVISSIDDRWNIFVLMAVSVLVGYGPSIAWCVFASRRCGTGHPLARPRGALALGRPRVGTAHLAVDDARRRHRRATDQGARHPLPQQPRRRRRRRTDRTAIAAFAIAAIVVAPVVEEVIFRGVMLRGLLLAPRGAAGDRGPGRLVRPRPLQPTFGATTSGW